jgi:hypothetical protein
MKVDVAEALFEQLAETENFSSEFCALNWELQLRIYSIRGITGNY